MTMFFADSSKKGQRQRYGAGRLSITALGLAQVCSWGTLYYSFPQLAEAMMTEFGWHKSEVYGALTVSLLFSAIAALPIGRAIDAGYGRQVMTLGSFLAGSIFIAGSRLETLWSFYLVFAGIGLLHAATLYEAAFSVIAHRFDAGQAKKHITTLTLWGGFASTVFIPLIEWSLQQGGWRNTMLILGLLNIFVCAVIYSRLPEAGSEYVDTQETAKHKKTKTSSTVNVRWALQQPIFWALLLCFSIFGAAGTTFKFHLYPLLMEKGLTATEVVGIIAVLGPSQVLGRFLLALFPEKISIVNLGIVTAATLPIVFAAFAYLPAVTWMLIPFAIAFGAATGTMTIVKGIAIPELLTQQAYGAINAAMNIPVKLIKAFAPAIAAVLWTIGNNYTGVLIVLMGLGLAAAISFALASKVPSYSHCDVPETAAP
ncbi:MAG: MFS transporter [Moraxellaceae bacterium]|nr:MAG: MFS transporter [Moraxellaceae bacterium]